MNMLRAVMAGLCVVSLCAGAAQAKPSVHPVGTLRYDPAKCWNSYVILANEGGSGGSAKLIDRNGNLVSGIRKADRGSRTRCIPAAIC